MNRGFWDKLKKPIMALAPMADVTDAVFRQIIAKYGKPARHASDEAHQQGVAGGPDVFFTEFVSTDGLMSEGRKRLLVDFWYGENEHPIVAQIFGSVPEKFEQVAKMIVELGFDGVDINMGCPVKKVLNQNSCSALIRTPKLAQEIVEATKRGAGNLPVSIKTRIGFNKIDIENWIPTLLQTKPAALTVHLRTVKEMSLVPAHWELMPRIVELVNQQAPEDRPLILGNGDVKTVTEAEEKCAQTGADGVMIGRGIFGNPWLFSSPRIGEVGRGRTYTPSVSEKLRVMIEHTKLFEEKFKGLKNFDIMKKHYKAYVNGFDGAKELRTKLMEAKTAAEVESLVQEFLVATSLPLRGISPGRRE